MRKLFFLFLALVATTSLWAHDFQSGDLYYNITSSSAPYTVEVTYQQKWSSHNYFGLTSVTIPSTVRYKGTTYSVTSIGDYAFYDCSSLTSITIPNSVTSIGYEAFDGCSSLPVENNLRYADTYLVEAVDKTLSTYSIKQGTKWIGDHAFSGCSSLTSITIPNSVTSIGDGAFWPCSSLTSVTIGNSVTSIGDEAFRDCSSLTTPVYNAHCFAYMPTSFKGAYVIPEGIKQIAGGAFYDCSSLTSVTIGNSVTSIGGSAFHSCSSLTSITIPNSVTSIGSHAFSWCTSLTTPVYNAHCFAYMPTSFKGAYVIPEGIKQIAGGAFRDCSSLTSITIPNSVTSIGGSAFADCSRLTSITIPNSVTSIGGSAFADCSRLTSITIPNSVTSIGWNTFYSCSSLTSVTIPNSVTSIESNTFQGCSSLTSITIPNSVTSIGGWAFANCTSLTSITIGNSVTSIGDGAFRDCSSLTSVTIPNSVTYIEDEAFRDCSSLTSVTIPNSVTSIGDRAFEDCSSLTSVTIPNSVTSIGWNTFYSCSSLTSVTIPNSVTSIGWNAFEDCSSLTSITIPYSVTSIGVRAFSGCSRLTSITIPNSVTTVGGGMFYGCSKLKSVVLSNNITSLPSYGVELTYGFFENCSSLTSVTIPNSVTSIGWNAFDGCSSLATITCEATTPPTVREYAFYDVSKSIPIYVPCGCVEAYKAASGWSDFTNIQESLVKYSIEVNVNNTIMGSAKVDWNRACDTQISATPNIGYHFVQWSDGNTDNPRTLELIQDTILIAEFAQSFSGQCGDSLYWEYDSTNKTITITGSGDMYNYTADTQPWLLFKEEIAEVTISNTATSIGTSAFEGCIRLGKVSIGTATKNIAANAFATCTKLYDIYCLAAEPPTGYTSSFANYNAFLHVPCESQRLYMLDILFGEFKYIECIASDEVPTDDIVITPGSTDVTITWPTEGNADTYTIVIKKDGEVVCTLTFNADGQLLNIAFAPGRDGNHPAQYAEAVANGGYRFTVTGLEEATDYTYTITTKDASNKTINTHSGKFTTKSITAVENTHSQSPMTNCQKLIRNGQLVIIRDGKTYNAQGVRL